MGRRVWMWGGGLGKEGVDVGRGGWGCWEEVVDVKGIRRPPVEPVRASRQGWQGKGRPEP